MQLISSQLLQLSTLYRRVFVNDVKELDTNMTPVSSVVQNVFLPSLRRNINQFNTIHGDKSKEPPRERNSQPPAAHFKSRASPSKTNPLISAIMGRLNHHAIDNGYVRITTSEFPVESDSESVPDPDTNPIKSIGGD